MKHGSKPKPAPKDKPTAVEQARYQKRKMAVYAVRQGEKPTVVARVFRVPRRTLFYWLELYRHGGGHALREAKRSGRPRKVNAEVLQWLYQAITLGDPRQYQFEYCLWTLGIIRAMLKRFQGIELSKSGVSRLLRHLGLSVQVPKYKSYRQDPRKLRRYLRRTFPQVVREARRTGAVIYFVDEAALRADAHRGTTWAPVGQTPVVEDSGDRFGLRLISAVSPRGDLKFATFEGRMTSRRFVDFLKKLRADAGKPIIVIADKATYHKDGAARRYRQATDEGIRVELLPAYSPELNPDEQVWNHLKARLGKLFIESREQMKRLAKATLLSIQRNLELVLSFFELKDTLYAADAI
jgi:transposase